MTPYAIDRNLRYTIFSVIFLTSFYLRDVLQLLVAKDTLPSSTTINGITIGAIAGALYFVFNKYFWKVPGLFGRPLIPDLSGTWYGYILNRQRFQPSASDPRLFESKTEEPIPVQMRVQQTFSDIGIWLNAVDEGRFIENTHRGRMASDCTMASIEIDTAVRARLRYAFKLNDLEGDSALVWERTNGRQELVGAYSSNLQRKAELELTKPLTGMSLITCGKIQKLPLTGRGSYVGVIIPPEYLRRYERLFRRKVGKKRYNEMVVLRRRRDGDYHHVTVVEPQECDELRKHPARAKELDDYVGRWVWIELMALGRQEKDGREAYYVIAHSPLLQKYRLALSLPQRDLHATLGFCTSDIHNIDKSLHTKV